MLDSFRNFAYVSSYLHVKSFALQTTNAKNFIKTILESSYLVLLVTCNLVALRRHVFFLTALEFEAIFAFKLLQLLLYIEKNCEMTF